MNDKQILCKLPHSINEGDAEPEVCLIVKDAEPKKKKDRDFDKSVRKYQQIVDKNHLTTVIKHILPIKQLKLEFRNFETKRKLCNSFDLFLADKCLHSILFCGSKLGVEFHKKKKMPIEIEIENDKKDLGASVKDILHSTMIHLSGKGVVIDIKAFLSTHSVSQILENLSAIKRVLAETLPGGEANIKSMYLKATNALAVPIYVDQSGRSLNEIKVPSNMTPAKIKLERKKTVKRLRKKKESNLKKKRLHPRQLIIEKTKSELLIQKLTPSKQDKKKQQKNATNKAAII